MGTTELIALSMGMAWASGVNLYATLGVLGIMGATGNMDLPPDLAILTSPMVIVAACAMYVIEFFADKIPGVDTIWDTLHTFIRIPAGAMLAAGALGDVGPAAEMTALILGGGMAGVSHGVKAGSRVLINASPEPFTNWAASTGFPTRWCSSRCSAYSSCWRFGCCRNYGAASSSCSPSCASFSAGPRRNLRSECRYHPRVRFFSPGHRLKPIIRPTNPPVNQIISSGG